MSASCSFSNSQGDSSINSKMYDDSQFLTKNVYLQSKFINATQEVRSKSAYVGQPSTPSKENLKNDSSLNEGLSVEEELVIYYIVIAIRLSKLSDGRKAIFEYSKKRNLSIAAHAYLNQFKGLIAMLHQKKDLTEVEANFNTALQNHH